jgi:CTP synthase
MKKSKRQKCRYIFVSGGVMSSLGKGVTSASVALLLKRAGFRVCPIKCENNLNVDFGTLNPIEHGDPFLCADGLESDLDLGNYERFLEQEVGHDNFMTMGQLYKTVIDRERQMGYHGEDVEPIPHVVNEIISRFKKAAKKSKADFVVIELGGTVGEYQNNNALYYEASRIMSATEDVFHIHVTYVIVPPHIGEPKTKPAQLGIRDLMSMGIVADSIVARSEIPVDEQRKYKFALKFNLRPDEIFSNENLDTIYSVPIHLNKQNIIGVILRKFKMKARKKIDLSDWRKLVKVITTPKKKKIKIAIVGKYFGTGDSQIVDTYYALIEAINHASWREKIEVDVLYVNSQKSEKEIDKVLKGVDGIIVPIGWGSRGVKGKLEAIRYAREKKIPYLGLCYGMQLACLEYARNVLKISGADTEENSPKARNKIIHSIPFNSKYQVIKGDGCSMRLGTYDCVLKKGSLVYNIYDKHSGFKDKKKRVVSERHRHRFEFNNDYREVFEKNGFIFSGTSPDNFFVEMIELSKNKHPFFVATQGHPEYKSRPNDPHPMFLEFIKACHKHS